MNTTEWEFKILQQQEVFRQTAVTGHCEKTPQKNAPS